VLPRKNAFYEAIFLKHKLYDGETKEFRKRLVIKLGDFHTVMSFCSAIGKIFKDAGLLMLFDSLSTSYSITLLKHIGYKKLQMAYFKVFFTFFISPWRY
jgi:hypothetical protein